MIKIVEKVANSLFTPKSVESDEYIEDMIARGNKEEIRAYASKSHSHYQRTNEKLEAFKEFGSWDKVHSREQEVNESLTALFDSVGGDAQWVDKKIDPARYDMQEKLMILLDKAYLYSSREWKKFIKTNANKTDWGLLFKLHSVAQLKDDFTGQRLATARMAPLEPTHRMY